VNAEEFEPEVLDCPQEAVQGRLVGPAPRNTVASPAAITSVSSKPQQEQMIRGLPRAAVGSAFGTGIPDRPGAARR
jgi:hypothetical protein